MQDRPAKPKQRMERKQIFITAEQNRRLKMLAAQSGRAEPELVREGLDLALEGASVTDENWRERLSEVLASLDGTSFDAAIVKRMRRNKAEQAAKWRKRLERTRKALSGE